MHSHAACFGKAGNPGLFPWGQAPSNLQGSKIGHLVQQNLKIYSKALLEISRYTPDSVDLGMAAAA